MCAPPCRFTARVDELLQVLWDLQEGQYQYTMVSSKPAEEQDNGVCGLPPMQYNYIVVTKFYYQCLAQVCSSGVGTVCIDDTFSATYMCVIWHHGWLML